MTLLLSELEGQPGPAESRPESSKEEAEIARLELEREVGRLQEDYARPRCFCIARGRVFRSHAGSGRA